MPRNVRKLFWENGMKKRKIARCLLAGALVLTVMGAGEVEKAPKEKLPFKISRETTAVESPLRSDGTPDYTAAINDKYGKGVKPEENAYMAWLEVTGTEVIPEKLRARLLEMGGGKETSGMQFKS